MADFDTQQTDPAPGQPGANPFGTLNLQNPGYGDVPYGGEFGFASGDLGRRAGMAIQALVAGVDPDDLHPAVRSWMEGFRTPLESSPTGSQTGLLGSLNQLRALAASMPSAAPAPDSDSAEVTQAQSGPAVRVPINAAAQGDGADRPLDYPERTVSAAVAKALTAMGRSKDIGNIVPYDPNYAKVRDPTQFDKTGWPERWSYHAKAWEAPIPGYSNYTLKYYDDPVRGHVISVVPPTDSFEHGAFATASLFDLPINTYTAEQFLKSHPEH